jgi:hypothetical protein
VTDGSVPSYEFWGIGGRKLAVCSQPDNCDACPADAENYARFGSTSPFVNCTTAASYLYDYNDDPSPDSGPEHLTCWVLNVTGTTSLGTTVQLQPCDGRFAGQCLTLSGKLDNVPVYNSEKKVFEVQNQRAILRSCSEVQGWQLMDIGWDTRYILKPFFLANAALSPAVTVASAPPITITPARTAMPPIPTSPPNAAPSPIQVLSSPEPTQVAMLSPSLPPAPGLTASPVGAQSIIPAVATGTLSSSGGSLCHIRPVGFTLLALVYVFG